VRLVRFQHPGRSGPSLGVVPEGEDRVRDLTAVGWGDSPLPLLRRLRADPERAREELAAEAARAPAPATLEELEASGALLPPAECPEVWAAGVTYERSRQARDRETSARDAGGTPYDRVYEAERPELFFKATAYRVRPSGATVGLRRDSRWQVPEPELALVLDEDGTVLGFTLGNDMSSRDIEGENPLYLPQAKIFRNACAVGPAVVPAPWAPAEGWPLTCRVLRAGRPVWSGETHTRLMRRSFATLVAYLLRHNWLPPGSVLLTGTGIVPPDEFTLEPGDVVEIASPRIGTLRNTCAWA
jgi:2-dehydro-3-deoxy-D-arabinonate dehydratase